MKVFVHVGLVTMSVIGTTFAHHGSTEYDRERVIRYEGVVAEVHWRNPHNVIVLETTDSAGRPLVLSVEGGGPSVLGPLGVTKDSILPGDHVIAVVSPSRRSPERRAFGREVIKDDGTIVPLGLQALGSPEESAGTGVALGLFGTWLPSRGILSDDSRKDLSGADPAGTGGIRYLRSHHVVSSRMYTCCGPLAYGAAACHPS